VIPRFLRVQKIGNRYTSAPEPLLWEQAVSMRNKLTESLQPQNDRMPLASRDLPEANGLRRGLSTSSALGLNLIDMVGVGPFVTLPLIVTVMGGPQSLLGWIMGA